MSPTQAGQVGTESSAGQDDDNSTNPSCEMLDLLEPPLHAHIPLDWSASIPNIETTIPTYNTLQFQDVDFSSEMNLHLGEQSFSLETSTTSPQYSSQLEEYSSPQSFPDFASHTSNLDFPTPSSMSSHTSHSNRSLSLKSGSLRNKYRTRKRSGGWSDFIAPSTLPEYSSRGLIEGYNNHLITGSLLQIYHDVLENNLACWLARETCPYKMPLRSQLRSALDEVVSPTEGEPIATLKSNSVSSKSMYHRVKMLDHIAQSTGLIRLTHTENHAASKALNLVVVAFATQWAQGRRRREKMLSRSQDMVYNDQQDVVDFDMIDEFEENLQKSLWEQARKTLDELSSLESYRIVYAELIFGLIQRPWASSDCPGTSSIPTSHENRGLADVKSSLSHIARILSQDGPPLYTERAGRKMQVLKGHFEASDSGFLGLARMYSGLSQSSEMPVIKLNTENRSTIGLLYWLAVMFDTVSSSMNERPVVLGDEDCRHDGTYDRTYNCTSSTGYRWRLELYAQDDLATPSTTVLWPCSYDEAITAVTKSAAVKVLLFRYVSYLQNALRRQERREILEEIIQAAMQAYRYWNLTHGAFFRSLIKHYDSIPTQIKSWFPCIHIPWHLGALLLADLIEFVDRNGLGMDEASRSRLSTNTASKIRKSSAMELCDIARVTTPQEDSKFHMPKEQLSGYHFAVNEGSLLTEPWTVLLIRAFTKACVFYLSVAEDLRRHDWAILGQQSEDEYTESLKRCDSCVKALWFLGRKSEMARKISRVLDGLLKSQKGELVSEQRARSNSPDSAASIFDSVYII
ncbi:hypothetical protein NPX13_g6072 [Xylaria arbuscula]|uniref:Transcription factor domain-containing protein n=1 Tax=Xylaria arbuscula TaxID=114810 RepID=A0A9W8NCU8_9PEZI|nr:hypothetical protein NPX13_g6072 [Xylaria arbuscula]